MGVVKGGSISKQIQDCLDHFEEKQFDLNYKEKVSFYAPFDYQSDNPTHMLFYLNAIKKAEDQLMDYSVLTVEPPYDHVVYRDEEGHHKEERHIHMTLEPYQTIFKKGKVEVAVSFKDLGIVAEG